jgi:hypothetical protein
MISDPMIWTSAGSSFKMPIFAALCQSFSKNLVWTQLPTVGASTSAVLVLAFFAAAAAAAPAAVELLWPMAVALNHELKGNGSKDARQGQCGRRKTMTAAEWGKELLPLFSFVPPQKISRPSQPFVLKRKWQRESDRPCVGIA